VSIPRMSAKREARSRPATHLIEPGSARYFAWLYAGEQQPLAEALFEIEHEIGTSLRPGLEHQVAHLRLAWWRDECDRFSRGTPVHPATRRLLQLLPPQPGSSELGGLVECASWDLAAAPADTRDDLHRYCERWSRAMIVPWAAAASSADAACALGVALRETELLVHLAPDARSGRLRIPLDTLDALQIEPRCLAKPPWPAALASHVQERFELLGSVLRRNLGALDRPALHAWSAVTRASARRATTALPHACVRGRFDGLLDALHAWRAARASLRGKVRVP
jgi:phytoene/squalene synthetase